LVTSSSDRVAQAIFQYPERTGKGNVINRLREKAKGEILIFTDADIMFSKDLIYKLVRHFKNESIGVVATNISNKNMDTKGISIQEWSFMSRETRMKYREGKIWGTPKSLEFINDD
jgi:cellulose synthase/poly-beta-1,6-N-acetylglucosamine synthase-like glycosyltransferase